MTVIFAIVGIFAIPVLLLVITKLDNPFYTGAIAGAIFLTVGESILHWCGRAVAPERKALVYGIAYCLGVLSCFVYKLWIQSSNAINP